MFTNNIMSLQVVAEHSATHLPAEVVAEVVPASSSLSGTCEVCCSPAVVSQTLPFNLLPLPLLIPSLLHRR